MDQEASVVARHLKSYFIENELDGSSPNEMNQSIDEKELLLEPGILANCLIVALTTVAILLTKITLQLTRWINKLENPIA